MSHAGEREDPVITYRPSPNLVIADEHQVLGLYLARYADGFAAAIPHVGWPNTVSAEPLDLNVPEQRAIVLEEVKRMRAEYDERAAT